jgi:hypothetical protein
MLPLSAEGENKIVKLIRVGWAEIGVEFRVREKILILQCKKDTNRRPNKKG